MIRSQGTQSHHRHRPTSARRGVVLAAALVAFLATAAVLFAMLKMVVNHQRKFAINANHFRPKHWPTRESIVRSPKCAVLTAIVAKHGTCQTASSTAPPPPTWKFALKLLPIIRINCICLCKPIIQAIPSIALGNLARRQ